MITDLAGLAVSDVPMIAAREMASEVADQEEDLFRADTRRTDGADRQVRAMVRSARGRTGLDTERGATDEVKGVTGGAEADIFWKKTGRNVRR